MFLARSATLEVHPVHNEKIRLIMQKFGEFPRYMQIKWASSKDDTILDIFQYNYMTLAYVKVKL